MSSIDKPGGARSAANTPVSRSEPEVVSLELRDHVRTELESRRRPIYGAFFGLNEAPFDLTPNPRFLFLSTRQREALSNLRYALTTSKGFALILGEAGTGKTTLVRTALTELVDKPSRYVLVNNPTLNREEFYEFLAGEFGLSEAARRSKTRFLAELQAQVEGRYSVGGLTGLIVDEAQSLPHELLEEIRLLGNIETTTTKLLNIVLSGQPEFADRLNESSLRQLKQRLALRCELRPFTLEETAAYISGRIRIAGGSPGMILTRETVIALHESSQGIPRTINVLADNVLVGGFAAQVRPITVDVVSEVCRDFDLRIASRTELAPTGTASVSAPSEERRGDLRPAPIRPTPPERPMFNSPEKPGRRFRFFL
jgi:general secretion pathway protein A